MPAKKRGLMRTVPNSMSGCTTSMPKIGAPVTLASMSRRICGLPRIVQAEGSRSAISSGGAMLDASSATSP